ncbi:hypothetical protein, partial [Marinomonas polaris]|uniref:hypothetical protein n=1 Tax=Marinomonas polaris TaxID=293552 RepID=UPI003F962141
MAKWPLGHDHLIRVDALSLRNRRMRIEEQGITYTWRLHFLEPKKSPDSVSYQGLLNIKLD